MEKEYDVYYHRYSGAMTDELLEEEATTTEQPYETPEEVPGTVQLDGYNTVFDIKVSLVPVELVPVVANKL